MVCKHCGNQSDGVSRFCTNCGADLYAENETNPNAQQPAPAPTYPQPNYQQPPYQQPTYPQPNCQQPNYQQPPYQQPPYQQPGYGSYPPNYYQPPQAGNGNTWATWSMVMGILSIVCAGWLWSVLAFCFASAAKKRGYMGGKTTAGIVCGVIGLVISILVVVVSAAAAAG